MDAGERGRFICFGSDLSDRHRRERRIRMLAHLLDQTQVMVTVHGDQGELLYANEAALSAPGYTTATGLRQAQVGDSNKDTGQTLGERYETSCVGPAGTGLALQSTASRIEWDGLPATLTVATDISELKRTSEALAQASERMLLAADAGQFGVWDWHIADNHLDWDAWMLRLYGLPRDEFGGQVESWRQRVHPEDLDAAEAKVKRILEGDGPLDMCFRIIRPDGCVRHIRAYALVTRDQSGAPHRMIGINFDVTEQTATEAALRESEERFRLLVESSPVSVLLMQDGRYLYGNPAAAAMLGLASADDIVGLDACENIAPESLALVRARMAAAAAGESNAPTELAIRRSDGTVRWALSTSVPLSFAGQPAVLIIGQDSTERRRAEEERARLSEQLSQAQKMESVGLLAGGVAHDFNNMLSIILGHTELLLDEVSAQSEMHDDIKEIQNAAQRSADLTRQLLAFARKQTIQPRKIDLNETMPSMLRMLRRLIGESISLVWKPAPRPCPVMMDPSQIDQILANLCVNARDAIHDTGTVTIETDRALVDDCQTTSEPSLSLAPGEYVVLTVSDTGCGIPADVLPRIFEPFYTSKGIASGTGLGLSTVYGIVTQNSGTIRVDSVLGEGTSVWVYLPLACGAE